MLDSKRKKPFLHIQQAEIQLPMRHMQEVYHSRKLEKKDKRDLPHGVEESLSQDNQLGAAALEANVEKHPDEANELKKVESINSEKDSSPFVRHQEKTTKASFQRLKSFKEMNILEKLDYLIDFPKQLSPVSCIFETADDSIRGFLVKKTEESIEILKQDSKFLSIDIESLKEVKMIGIRR